MGRKKKKKKVISKHRKGLLRLQSGPSYNLFAIPSLGINKTNPLIKLTELLEVANIPPKAI